MQPGKDEIETNVIARYLEGRFQKDVQQNAAAGTPTGFSNIDGDTHGLQPGLYILAAAPSIGKTSFAIQLAEQAAAAGKDVVFFSIEHSRAELVAKGLARRIHQSGGPAGITAREIIQGRADQAAVDAAARLYADQAGSRLSIAAGDISGAGVKNYTERYIIQRGESPVLIIDYLQIMQPDAGGGTRERIDNTLQQLKEFSMKRGLTVIVISAINRQSYYTPVALDSMKETGGCEYFANVVWGLQPVELDSTDFIDSDRWGDSAARRAAALEALKQQSPRKMELAVVKDKMGAVGTRYKFRYYPEYDLFEPLDAQTADAPAKHVKRLGE